MGLPFHRLGNGRRVKLGCRTRKTIPHHVVQFGEFIDRPKARVFVPEAIDYSLNSAANLTLPLGNFNYGDCVIAGKLHQLGIWSGSDSDSPGLILPTEQEALRQYVQICGPGDYGCEIIPVLDYWRTRGLTAAGKSHLIDGWCAVDATDAVLLKAAIYLFGTVTFGIDLPSAWLSAPDDGLWDITSSRVVGGHDVSAFGFDAAGVKISTWGGKRTISWAALASGRYITECYLPLSPDWYGSDDLSPSGLDTPALQNALKDFAAGVLPVDPPPPVPPVPPVPPPPAPWVGSVITVPTFAVGGSFTQGTADQYGKFQTDLSITVTADGPITVSGAAGSHTFGAFPWAVILALIAKDLPIILADLAAGKTWPEILADIVLAQKSAAPALTRSQV
jgi:hypothetical protein